MISTAEPWNVKTDDPWRTVLRRWYPEKYWCYHATELKRTLGPKKEPQVVREMILTSYETKKCEQDRKKKARRNRRRR